MLFIPAFAFAQTAEKDVAIGLHLGTLEYAGERGNEFFSFGQHFSAGLSISQYLTPSFDVMGVISYGQIDHGDSLGFFRNRIYNFNLLAKYKFANGKVLKQDARFAPFIFAGIADAFENAVHYTDNLNMAFNFPVGAGLDVRLNDTWSVSLMTSYNYYMNDRLDNANYGGQLNWHDQTLWTTVGLKFSFPRLDRDKDGVRNKFDRCPEIAGPVVNLGCPEIPESDKAVMRQAMEGLFFETGSATIKSESYVILDQVVSLLQLHPEYSLNIFGHTDNTGNAEMNNQLSKDRAQAAKQYLINKGIAAER
ncbi:MAG: hypothetical protein RL226_1186, partial [Bacteroidota bacterium]